MKFFKVPYDGLYECIRRFSLIMFHAINMTLISMGVLIGAAFVPWPWSVPYLLTILVYVVGLLFVADEMKPL